MKKIYGLIGLGMLTFVLFFSMVSALSVTGGEINWDGEYVIINISETNQSINATNVNLTYSGDFDVIFNETDLFDLNNEIERLKKINVSLNSDKGDLEYGEYTITLTVNSDEGNSDTSQITLTKSIPETFCEAGPKGDLEIKNFDITNNGAGDDDEWEMFDEVTIEIEIENTNNDEDEEIDDVQLEIKILDNMGKDVTSDFIEDDESVDLGRIYGDGDSEIEIFNLKVTSDVDEGTYYMYVKAYEDNNEDLNCIDNSDDELNEEYYYEFDVNTDEDFKIDELTIDTSMGCGDSQTVYFDLYNFNLGDDEEMRVNLYNAELGIDLYSEIFELDEGKKEDLSFEIEIPEDVEEKTYKFKIYVEHNYREDDDLFKDTSEDTEEFSIVVEGNCRIEAPLVDVKQLDEDVVVRAGDTVEIELTLANQEDDEIIFVLAAEDYSLWANSIKISEPLVTLVEGGATIVKYTLTLKDDLETGDYSFNMVVSSEGKTLVTQPVAVTIEAKKGLSDLFDDVNWKLVGIILVNLILLIAIIVVVRKILKKK